MKTLLLGLLALALGAGGLFAAGPLGDDPTSDRTIPLTFEPASSTTTGTTTTTSTNASTTTTTPTGTTGTVEDVSGPCDEAEHANDPRCTGAGPTTTREDDDGDRGGRDDDGGDDDHGGNSGPGGGSGSGGGGSSGSGGGGGSDDRSGSNSGSG